jgi:hypothetical protein
VSVERGHAYFGGDGKYRYALHRKWSDGPSMLFIGLNPSTADADRLDPTLRRVVHFAMRENCGGMWVANLFAFRATDPRDLIRSYGDTLSRESPIGPENDNYLQKMAGWCQGHIVAGWGTHGGWLERDTEVCELLKLYEIQCWGLTKDGHPKHPLYLRGDTPLTPYVPAYGQTAVR